jgi:hypothetical protein
MSIKQQLETLHQESGAPCVSISLNTHRTHPQNAADAIVLKNLLKQAEDRIIHEFGKRPVQDLLDKINTIETQIDHNHNLDSLNIFLSNETTQIIRSAWPVQDNVVHISDAFSLRPVIHALSRSVEYYILLLSQSGAHLYEAINDGIHHEVRAFGFPFPAHKMPTDKISDSKQSDDSVREYLNKIDKALVSAHNQSGMQCVVIATEDNYSRLQQVADKPSVYSGYAAINYNNTALHFLAEQAWSLIKDQQVTQRAAYIDEVKRAVAEGKVLTDIQEIYQAAIDGRADLLIVHEEYTQPVMKTGERTFDLIQDSTQAGAIDDITSLIASEVTLKNGKVIFTSQTDLLDLGKIALKTRY